MLSLLALLAALILLALPKANEFFRKPTAGWEPPVPGASYPAVPAGARVSPATRRLPVSRATRSEPAYPPGAPAPSAPASTPAAAAVEPAGTDRPAGAASRADRPGPDPAADELTTRITRDADDPSE